MRSRFACALAALFLSAAAAQAEAPRTIIVMDGSGSMWGQIDGRPKLEIARETVAKVLGTLPPDQELGLMAYGHRSKGDCSDIELIVPPAKGTAGTIGERVQSMRFLGKTPLSAAVRQAAEALRYGEEAATVVLVTDGLETCSADPCALGRELEAAGLDFTAHVIGFGLTKEEGAQVACLAENTGGRYIAASNANALRDALASTVTAQAPPTPKPAAPTATLSAPDSAPAGSLLAVGFKAARGEFDYVYLLNMKGERVAEAAVGDQNPLSLRLPVDLGPHELVYSTQAAGIIARRPLTVTETELMLDAPDSAPAGSLIEIGWAGPASENDFIQLLDAKGERVAEVAVADGNPATLRLPFTPGSFTLVYSFKSHEPIVRRPISLTEGKVVLTAPERAQVGSEVSVGWAGPAADFDNIQLVRQSDGDRVAYEYVKAGNPLTFKVPDEPGIYEFLYVFGDREVIARRPITVVLEKVEASPAPGQTATSPAAPGGTALSPEQQVRVTFQAATAGGGPSVSWSATPVPGQNLPPEAWAMNESSADPVEAEFFPGTYDVVGDAGDTVFAGRITVVAGAPNRFAIPYSPALSPAGEDPPRADDGLVTLQLTGIPDDGSIRWFVYPVGGQDTLAVASTDAVTGPWATRVDPGAWLIIGKPAGSGNVSHVALAQLSSSPMPLQLSIAPASQHANEVSGGEGIERACEEPGPCLFRDAATGLGLLLPGGWGMDTPLIMETAASVAAQYPSALFRPLRPDRGEALIALNPRQWDAMLGPCETTAIGTLCRTEPMSGPDLQAYRMLAATLEVAAVTPTTRAAMTGGGMPAGMLTSIGAIEVKLPDGLDPLVILAPQLAGE